MRLLPYALGGAVTFRFHCAHAGRSSLARCEQLTGEAAGVLDQYMQRIDDLDRIIQPVAARTQARKNSNMAGPRS